MRAVCDRLVREKSIRIGERVIELCNHSTKFKAGLSKRLPDLQSNQARKILLLRLQAFPTQREGCLPLLEAQLLPAGKRSL